MAQTRGTFPQLNDSTRKSLKRQLGPFQNMTGDSKKFSTPKRLKPGVNFRRERAHQRGKRG